MSQEWVQKISKIYKQFKNHFQFEKHIYFLQSISITIFYFVKKINTENVDARFFDFELHSWFYCYKKKFSHQIITNY